VGSTGASSGVSVTIMHEWDVCIRMMPMMWKWDDMQWHGNRRKISLQRESNAVMAPQARLLILILGPRRTLLSKTYTSINHDLIWAHRGY
jgi:hypothetical protein